VEFYASFSTEPKCKLDQEILFKMTFSPEFSLYAKSLIGVLAIVNPLGVVPVFLSMCGDRTPAQCNQVARTGAIALLR